jgi:hypothetical protein
VKRARTVFDQRQYWPATRQLRVDQIVATVNGGRIPPAKTEILDEPRGANAMGTAIDKMCE